MEIYNIKIGERYLLWIDDHWYETSANPSLTLTKEEAIYALNLLKKHYVYNADVLTINGEKAFFLKVKNNIINTEKPQIKAKYDLANCFVI